MQISERDNPISSGCIIGLSVVPSAVDLAVIKEAKGQNILRCKQEAEFGWDKHSSEKLVKTLNFPTRLLEENLFSCWC